MGITCLKRSTVVEDLMVTKSSNKAVAYFYCQHDDPKKRDARVLLGTLLYHITEQIPLFPSIEFPTFDSSIKEVSVLQKSIATLSTGFGNTYLVIDALDELDIHQNGVTADRKSILPILKDLAGIPHLRLLVTSREKDEIKRAFELPSITLREDHVSADINNYIEQRILLARPGTKCH
jgi:hypothetical protein